MIRKTRRLQRLEMEKTIMVLTKGCSLTFFFSALLSTTIAGNGTSSQRRHPFKVEFLQL